MFRAGYKEFPKGKLVGSESPDFILKITPRKSIGIEITKIGRPNSPEQTGNKLTSKDVLLAVKKAVAKKESKCKLYEKNRFYNTWLLLTMESATQEIVEFLSELADRWEPDTGFDRVFLMDWFDKNIWVLKGR